MTKIHTTALIDPKAQLDPTVSVGAYAVIGPHVVIGKDTIISSHVTVDGYTQIGERCHIYSYACLGSAPQVRKLPHKSYLKIGDDNTIREYVTMNPGMAEESSTIVGDNNFLMMNAHSAHDCILGSQITIANGVALAGHVTIENCATVGGLSGIHQFVRVGQYAMLGAMSKAVMDIAPFSTCDGNPASFYGINTLGLKRAEFSPADRLIVRRALKILLASGKKLSSAVEEVRKEFPGNAHIGDILHFVTNSRRGVARANSDFSDNEEIG